MAEKRKIKWKTHTQMLLITKVMRNTRDRDDLTDLLRVAPNESLSVNSIDIIIG